MILSRYNKFIFSVFSSSNDCLILTIYLIRNGKSYSTFLNVQCSKGNSAGDRHTTFDFSTELKIIDITSRVITFSKGKMIFMDDEIKIDFGYEMVMFYLNYSWNRDSENPLDFLMKESHRTEEPSWNSSNFNCFVKGNFVSPNICSEFRSDTGSLDLLKSGTIPEKVNGLLWTRLHGPDLDLAYSLVFNGSATLHSNLSILYDNKLIEFTDVDYMVEEENFRSKSGAKYPGNLHLVARNSNCHITVSLRDQKEIIVSKLVDESNFFEKLARNITGSASKMPRSLMLVANADVKVINNDIHKEFNGVSSITEYTNVSKGH